MALPAAERKGAVLRLAEQLDRGQDQAGRAARLVPGAGDPRLSVEGDDRLARWSLERRLSGGAFRRVRRPARRQSLSAPSSSCHSAT